MTLGAFIYQRRMELGITAKALAQEVGISEQYMGDIIHGKRTPDGADLIERLAHALKVNSDILYFYTGRLAPDMTALPASNGAICAAYAALRSELVNGLNKELKKRLKI